MSNEKLITMQFSLNLRKILENRGLTQKELADKMGISKTAVNQWTQGKKMPRMGKIDMICKALGVERGALIENLPDLPSKHPTLTYDECQIIDAYRTMDRVHKEVIKEMAVSFGKENEQ